MISNPPAGVAHKGRSVLDMADALLGGIGWEFLDGDHQKALERASKLRADEEPFAVICALRGLRSVIEKRLPRDEHTEDCFLAGLRALQTDVAEIGWQFLKGNLDQAEQLAAAIRADKIRAEYLAAMRQIRAAVKDMAAKNADSAVPGAATQDAAALELSAFERSMRDSSVASDERLQSALSFIGFLHVRGEEKRARDLSSILKSIPDLEAAMRTRASLMTVISMTVPRP